MEILKLLIENPESGVILILSVASFIFYLGMTYTKMLSLEKGMSQLVTKKDVELAMVNFRASLEDTFVTVKDCDRLHQTGTIPMDEHVRLMTQQEMGLKRLDTLERSVEDIRIRHEERGK